MTYHYMRYGGKLKTMPQFTLNPEDRVMTSKNVDKKARGSTTIRTKQRTNKGKQQ